MIFVLDQNLGRIVLAFLSIRGLPARKLTSLSELGYAIYPTTRNGSLDLGRKSGYIAVTRDGNVLNAAIRREAWLTSGPGMILLDKKWGGFRARLAAPSSLWWPYMTARALEGKPGSAWTVSCRIAYPPNE